MLIPIDMFRRRDRGETDQIAARHLLVHAMRLPASQARDAHIESEIPEHG